MNSPLLYATHLGYLSPESPLFKESVGNLDPVRHIEFASAHGFRGVLYPWAVARPPDEVERVAAALQAKGMLSGCVAYASFETVQQPLWVRSGKNSREQVLTHIRRGARAAAVLSAHVIVLLIAGNEDFFATQRLAALENIRYAADVAAESDLILGFEPMIALPNMLFRRTEEAAAFVQEVNHPAFKLVFDTGHVAEMDGAERVLALFQEIYDQVAVLQLADQPGRVEPGAGEIDISGVLAYAMRRQHSTLVELEHAWSKPGAAGEADGLERFRLVDRAAQADAALLRE